ncbi:MAG: hypothetical protein KC481_19295 [Acidimicrobiaceae bacterium]|nr:hypothetical protein [Acidimicrobiaceae bacterium]
MAHNIRYQIDLFRDAELPQSRITESEQQRVTELLGELMLLVTDAEAVRMNREESGDE